jgi:pimeloyl-ACP methyl ester carboxylesterase
VTASKTVEIEGVRLAYSETGTGDPVVFVHGAFSDHRSWKGQIADLASDYRCLAIDQRYCGNSWTEVPDTYNLSTHAKDLGLFNSAVVGRPAHIVATSYGSAVALAWAASNPRACASLFLNEPALASLVTQPEDIAVLRRAREDLAAVASALSAGDAERAVALFCDWTAFPGAFATMPTDIQVIFTENARTIALAFAAPPPELGPGDLAPITMPVTFSVGAQTTPFFLLQVQAAHRALPQSRLIQIPHAHHAAPFENVQAFNHALRQHLGAARQAAA